jgi:hypothetical protein
VNEHVIENETVEEPAVVPAAEAVTDDQLIGMLVDRARTEGLQLTGEGGLLQQSTVRLRRRSAGVKIGTGAVRRRRLMFGLRARIGVW